MNSRKQIEQWLSALHAEALREQAKWLRQQAHSEAGLQARGLERQARATEGRKL